MDHCYIYIVVCVFCFMFFYVHHERFCLFLSLCFYTILVGLLHQVHLMCENKYYLLTYFLEGAHTLQCTQLYYLLKRGIYVDCWSLKN